MRTRICLRGKSARWREFSEAKDEHSRRLTPAAIRPCGDCAFTRIVVGAQNTFPAGAAYPGNSRGAGLYLQDQLASSSMARILKKEAGGWNLHANTATPDRCGSSRSRRKR